MTSAAHGPASSGTTDFRPSTWPVLVAVLLVALTLRGAISGVSPVLPAIRADLSMTAATAGLLTTLPVLCFAAAAPVAAVLSRRVGLERAVLAGTVAIMLGTVLRVLGDVPLLLGGTLAIGVAMTIGNVLVPVVIKRDFPGRASTVTGVYTAALTGGAAVAAAVTAPLAELWGWRIALASGAVLALAAAVVWHVATAPRRARRRQPDGTPDAASGTDSRPDDVASDDVTTHVRATRPWRHPVAWAVALFLAFQSTCYYSVTAWLPTLLVDDAELDVATAGAAMSAFQLLGIAGTLLIPLLAGRRPNQSWLGVAVSVGWTAMVVGLLLWPAAWVIWTVVGGIAQGAGISYAFTVLVLRAHDATAARALSGMAQLVGYSFGAAGPVVIGALYEQAAGWTAPLLVLSVVAVAQSLVGWLAGRNRTVGSHQPATP